MTPVSRADAYAVIGNPVRHSLSPQIHSQFAAQTNQPICYEAIETDESTLESCLQDLRQRGYLGLNITVPLKEKVWKLCDQISPRADNAKAVNTLSFMPNGELVGDNTDGVGLTRDLIANLGVTPKNQHILVLGAGGAVRGVLGPILAQAPESLTIANRTIEKAEKLAADFADMGPVRVSAYADLGATRYDLIINGTSAGLSKEIPPIPDEIISPRSVCYDMVYSRSGRTAFVDWAYSQGATHSFDGLGMLVEQAAESFRIWRGMQVSTTDIIRSLRSS